MTLKPICLGVCLALFGFHGTAPANTYQIILHGKVVMADGSPPPVIVGIERICSDNSGSAPGPLTNKKGEYIWKMEIDPLETRDCRIRATHSGYASSSVEVSGLDTTRTALELPPLIVNASVADPTAIIVNNGNIPGKSRKEWDQAMKALDVPKMEDAASHLQAAVDASPKFSEAWHALGVVEDHLNKPAEARAAFQHAIEANPKLLAAYVMLTRVCVKLKDWDGVEKAVSELDKVDPKHSYPEVYLHLAVAQYGLKDYTAAESSVQEEIRLDTAHHRPRAEYVLGRILEAKGDINGAKEHMMKYLEMEPAPVDLDLVKGHMEHLGKPEAAAVDPALEPL